MMTSRFNIWEHSNVAMFELLHAAREILGKEGVDTAQLGINLDQIRNAEPAELLSLIDSLDDTWGFDISTGQAKRVKDVAMQPSRMYDINRDNRGMITVLPSESTQTYTLIGAPFAYGGRIMREQPGFVLTADYNSNGTALDIRAMIGNRCRIEAQWKTSMPLREVYDAANTLIEEVARYVNSLPAPE